MYRSTKFLTATLACMGVWLAGATVAVRGGVLPQPLPGPVRIAKAEAVIVGKVEALEPQDVKAENGMYRIAVVKISQGLKGTKDAKTLRIGFPAPPKPPAPGDKGPRIIRTGARPIQLQVGQEGLFLLKKHAKEDFYVIGDVVGYYVNSEKNEDFDKEVQAVKTITSVMANPQASLKAKDGDERLLAASILINQYRTYRGPGSRQEPIDAAESKQIMQALADGDWKSNTNMLSFRPNPVHIFRRLGVSAQDGFAPPPPGGNFQAAAQAWAARERLEVSHSAQRGRRKIVRKWRAEPREGPV